MYNSVIIVVLISSVIDINSAGFALVNSCLKFNASLWTDYGFNGTITTIWCENKCKDAVDKFLYYGTHDKNCYCRQMELSESEGGPGGQCNIPCVGNRQEMCGGGHKLIWLISVAEIYRPNNTVTAEDTLTTSITTTSVFQPITATTKLLSTDTSPLTVTHDRPSNTVTAEVTLTTSITTTPVIQPITTTTIKMLSTDTTPPTVTNDRPSNTVTSEDTLTTSITTTSVVQPITTTTKLLSTDTSPLTVTNGIRPRKLSCKCPKRLINTKWHFLDGKNITDTEVRKMVVEDFNKNIKSEISVDKKTVSKEVRKKNSSVNKRKSSQSIGSGCVVFLVFPVAFLIAIDILNCCIHFKSRIGERKRNRIGPTSDIQDSRDSSKPLHENVSITESYYASRCGNDFHPDEMKLETY